VVKEVILEKLLEIYESSKLNSGEPKCIFAETLIFSEGWLLRGILERWAKWKHQSKFPFLPFPEDVGIRSEAQLYTPFKKRAREDRTGENNTHVDGIVGHFSIPPNSKSGVKLDKDWEYLAVFEAKMYSELADRVANINNYNQVSRNIACIINSILRTERLGIVHFVVTYPGDNRKIEPAKYTRSFIESQIEHRIRIYEQYGSNDEFSLFKERWKDILRGINIRFITWEEVISELGNRNIEEFYGLCKKYNCYEGI